MGYSLKIAQNTLYQVVGKVVTMITTLIITAIITRDLGDSGYGQFTLIMGYAAFFYIVADFGINAVVVKMLGDSGSNTQDNISATFFLRLILSTVLMLIGVLGLLRLPYEYVVKVGIIFSLLTIYTQSLYTSVNSLFQFNLKYHLSSFSLSFASALLLLWVLMVRFFVTDNTLIWYVAGYVFHGLVMFSTSFYLAGLAKEIGLLLKPNWRQVRELFYASLPLGLMLLFAQVHGKADIFLLSILPLPDELNLTTNETLGMYGLGYKMFEVVLVFATFFMNASYPIMLKKYKDNWIDFQKVFKKIVFFLLFCGFIGFIFLFVSAPFLINIISGSGFDHSILALRLLSIGIPAFFVTSAFQWYIVAVDKQKVLPLIYLIGGLITVLLNLIYIPEYSYIAASVITWVVEFIILVMMSLFMAKWYLQAKATDKMYGSK